MMIAAKHGDILDAPVDVLVLKFANAFRGADLAVASKLGFLDLDLPPGVHKFLPTRGAIASKEILLISVGPLRDFDYAQISSFATKTLDIILQERPLAQRIGLTVHGPGYGLDELAAIDSLISGLRRAAQNKSASAVSITIIERDAQRYGRLLDFLKADAPGAPQTLADRFTPDTARAISSEGTYDRRLFAAMPFKERFLDHWEYALQPAAHANNVVIERLDHEHFVGEILTEIRTRIERASAVIALLDENNPNVFLEVGYAWGVRKPTILALHTETQPPFDVSGHKLIRYNRIGDLRAQLEVGLKTLLDKQII